MGTLCRSLAANQRSLTTMFHCSAIRRTLAAYALDSIRRFAGRTGWIITCDAHLCRFRRKSSTCKRIDGVFDAIVDCDSGAELFARVRA